MSSSLWTVENVYSGWLHVSATTMAGALLFYHMTRLENPTLRVDPQIAAFISSGLIMCDVIFGVIALIPYNLRATRIFKNHEDPEISEDDENVFRWFDTFGGAFFLLIQIMIAIYIIKDSIARVHH